jgi:signal peptidase I
MVVALADDTEFPRQADGLTPERPVGSSGPTRRRRWWPLGGRGRTYGSVYVGRGKHSKPPPDKDEPPSFGRYVLDVAVVLLIAFIIATAVKTWVLQPFEIPSGSMENTLQVSDRVIVEKVTYRLRDPRAGEIVTFSAPDGSGREFIKRVIAVGGQTVDVQDGVVSVDGRRLTEPYVNTRYKDDFSADAPVKVPAGTVYLMGDNRTDSSDSRAYGPQPLTHISGRAFAIYWPLSRIRGL